MFMCLSLLGPAQVPSKDKSVLHNSHLVLKAFLSAAADSISQDVRTDYQPHPANSHRRPWLGRTVLLMHITVLTNLC